MQKTKLQILEETEAYYTDFSKRGFNEDIEMCMYLTGDGKMCAVGRCMEAPTVDTCGTPELGICKNSNDLRNGVRSGLDDFLKEEYRGHDRQFWSQLQYWHDSIENFTDNGVTEEGKAHMAKLKEKYGDQ